MSIPDKGVGQGSTFLPLTHAMSVISLMSLLKEVQGSQLDDLGAASPPCTAQVYSSLLCMGLDRPLGRTMLCHRMLMIRSVTKYIQLCSLSPFQGQPRQNGTHGQREGQECRSLTGGRSGIDISGLAACPECYLGEVAAARGTLVTAGRICDTVNQLHGMHSESNPCFKNPT
jgi:hypothetical protein